MRSKNYDVMVSDLSNREHHKEYVSKLKAQGVNPLTAAPPLFRLLWLMGIHASPPLSNSFPKNLVLMFAIMAGPVAIGVRAGFNNALKDQGYDPNGVAAAFGLVVGALFATSMATYFHWKKRRLVVPDWTSH